MSLLEDILTNLIAGLLGTGILATAALLLRRVGPQRVQHCLDLSRQYIWALLALGFLASALVSAVLEGLDRARLLVLAGVGLAIVLVLTARRFVPIRFRGWESFVWRHPWELLTGLFLLTTLAQLVLPSEASLAQAGEQLIFVVDLADDELMGLREVLNGLEPALGAKVFLMNVSSDRYIPRLDRMVADDNMKWDIIAADNNMLGVLGAKCLVQDLKKYSAIEDLQPSLLIPALKQLYSYQGSTQILFAPFRPNVMVAFYNKTKFDRLQLKPPRTWAELETVARALQQQNHGVGRTVIQGYPGKPAAVTVYEFVRAAGGDPTTLAGPESQDAFRFLQRLQPLLAPEYREARFDTVNELLINDQVDLAVNWTFGIKVVIEDAGKDDIDVYSGWSGPKGEAHVLGGDILAIPRGAPHPDKAARLIELLLSRDVQQKLLQRIRWAPIRFDAYQGLPPRVQRMFDEVLQALWTAEPRPTNPRWALVERQLEGAFDAIVRQQGSLAWLNGFTINLSQLPRDFVPYRVRPGQALADVADDTGTTVEILAAANSITTTTSIGPDQVLLVPGSSTTTSCAS